MSLLRLPVEEAQWLAHMGRHAHCSLTFTFRPDIVIIQDFCVLCQGRFRVLTNY
jgi:hypothetical protein